MKDPNDKCGGSPALADANGSASECRLCEGKGWRLVIPAQYLIGATEWPLDKAEPRTCCDCDGTGKRPNAPHE
jgi:hypothetical protein